MEEKKVRKLSDNQKVTGRFLIFSNNRDNNFYLREYALAKRLIKTYTLPFLLWVPLPDNKKVDSLLWFCTLEGSKYLKYFIFEYKKYLTDLTPKVKKIKLSKRKIGEDTIIKKNPETLIEFLEKYKE